MMADMIDLAAQAAELLRGSRPLGGADIAQAEVVGKDDEGNVIVDLGQGQRTVAAQGVGAAVGDSVPVLLDGHGGAVVVSNVTDPPSNSIARQLAKRLDDVQDQAVTAREIAEEAAEAAGVDDAHVWSDERGTHVADVGQEEWGAAEANDFSDLSPKKQYHNILMNYLGILLRSAIANLVSITRSAIAFFDGEGNSANNIVARFGADGAQIGKSDESHMELDYHSLQLIDKESYQYFYVSDLRNRNDVATFTMTNVTYEYVEYGTRKCRIDFPIEIADIVSFKSNYPIAGSDVEYEIGDDRKTVYFYQQMDPELGNFEIVWTSASQLAKAYTLGMRADANIGPMSFATGSNVAAQGFASHVEGVGGSSFGNASHAEGVGTTAYGEASHAEGAESQATYKYSHAEGHNTRSWGEAAHAEGTNSTAGAKNSHAQNLDTKALSENQTALGKYNVEDSSGTYAAIIGNGTSDSARSNALAVEWDGTVHGKLFVGTGCTWGQLAAKFTWGQLAGRS